MQNKLLGLTAILALIGTASYFIQSGNVDQIAPLMMQYQQWKSDNGVHFSASEDIYRFTVFCQTVQLIEQHNADQTQTYTMGLNQFSAMTNEEWKQIYLNGLIGQQQEQVNVDEEVVVSQTVDWVAAGAVTPVKNQGQCGSCWSFSTTGGLEGLSKIGYGTLQSFSEQQLVDCSTSYGNQGCNGGLMSNALNYVKAKGIVLESQYPYTARQGVCKINSGPFKCSSYGTATAGNCASITNQLNTQPISIAVDASNWQNYRSGVFSNCGAQLDHGVLLVGITSTYQTVKNSWGTSWGLQGYIQLKLGNTCGMCNNWGVWPNK